MPVFIILFSVVLKALAQKVKLKKLKGIRIEKVIRKISFADNMILWHGELKNY